MTIVPRALNVTIRSLYRARGFTAAAIVTLALGLGANVAIFTIVSAVLLNPLPFKNADQLLVVMETDTRTSRALGVSGGTFLDWRDGETPFSEIGAWRFEYFNLSGHDQPDQVLGLRVSSSLLPLLGGQPRVGRGFDVEEERTGGLKVAIITDSLWRRRFGADPALVGRQVTIEHEPVTVVGILPPSFQFFRILNRPVDLFVPLALDSARASRASHDLMVYARIKPNETVAHAQAQMSGLYRDLAGRYPDTNGNVGVSVTSLPKMFTQSSRPALWLLFGTAAMVLLIASANLTNLLLARAFSRNVEMTIRAALGANRTQLARHVLLESVVVSVLAAVATLFLVSWGAHLLNELVPPTMIGRMRDFQVDVSSVSFSFVLSLVCGLTLGLLPACVATTSALDHGISEIGRGLTATVRTRRVAHVVVVAEVAIAVVLLTAAMLMISSARGLTGMSRGLNAKNVLTMQLWLSPARYPSRNNVIEFYDDVLTRLSRVPGVESVSAINFLPLSRLNGGVVPFAVDGRQSTDARDQHDARYAVIDSRYFHSMQIPLLAGRAFREDDGDETDPVAIIDKALADRIWPNGNPIGERIRVKLPPQQGFWVPQSTGQPMTVVGIVGAIKEDGANLMGRDAPVIYVPYRQNPSAMMHVVARSFADPLALVPSVRREVWAVDRELPVSNVQLMTAVIQETFATAYATSRLIAAFALLAAGLATTGVFALVGYLVGERTKEIGVRMALGAGRGEVFRAVIGEGATIGLIGAMVGTVAAVGAHRLLASQLFGVSPGDPLTLLVGATVLVSACVAACYIPARRAMNIAPVVALRGS